jgi:DNA repair ATPase RecN
MAGPTLSQQLVELKAELKEVAEEFATFKAVAEYGKKVNDDRLAEVDVLAKKLQERLSDALVKLAAIEERIKALEKGSDRRWQLAPMVLTGVSIFISLVSAVVAVIALTTR